MEALVVRDLGLVAGLDERLEAGADELGHAAAEDGLLAEEVGLGLLGERRLDHPGARRADPDAVREREVERAAARVLGDRDDRRRPEPLGEQPAHDVPRALRRDHDHVVPGGWRDAPVVDVEAVREEERGVRDRGSARRPPRTRAAAPDRAAGARRPARRARLRRRCRRRGPPLRRPPATELPSRRPTWTSTPESWRLRAWAWPWLP